MLGIGRPREVSEQMIGVSENNLRRPGVFKSRAEARNGALIQIVPDGVQRLLSFIENVALSFSESLNLFPRQR